MDITKLQHLLECYYVQKREFDQTLKRAIAEAMEIDEGCRCISVPQSELLSYRTAFMKSGNLRPFLNAGFPELQREKVQLNKYWFYPLLSKSDEMIIHFGRTNLELAAIRKIALDIIRKYKAEANKPDKKATRKKHDYHKLYLEHTIKTHEPDCAESKLPSPTDMEKETGIKKGTWSKEMNKKYFWVLLYTIVDKDGKIPDTVKLALRTAMANEVVRCESGRPWKRLRQPRRSNIDVASLSDGNENHDFGENDEFEQL